MDLDLASHLDRSIGPAPDHDLALAGLLEQGHRAVARRRLASAGASALVVLVVAGGVALATGGGPNRVSAPVAGDPSPTSATQTSTWRPSVAPTPTSNDVQPTPPDPTRTVLWDDALAAFDRSGAVVVADGATVVERIDNPYGVPAPAESVGLAVEKDGTTYWYALYRDAHKGTEAASKQAGRGTLTDWLRRHSRIVTANDPPGISPDATTGSGLQ